MNVAPQNMSKPVGAGSFFSGQDFFCYNEGQSNRRRLAHIRHSLLLRTVAISLRLMRKGKRPLSSLFVRQYGADYRRC